MKKKLSILLAAVMAVSVLVGCGNNGATDGLKETESATESAMKDSSASKNNNSENIGNNPNNLYQSEYCLAFDDEHIYYSRDKLVSIDFNGKNRKESGTNTGRGMNLYNGYIYSFGDNVIYRLKIDTDEEETLVQFDNSSVKSETKIQSIFLANGYLFYSVQKRIGGYSDKSNITEIYAMNVDNNEQVQIYRNSDEIKNVYFSADNKSIYALIEGETSTSYKIWQMKIEDISANAYLNMISDGYYKAVSTIIEPNGVYYVDRETDENGNKEIGYKFKAFLENSVAKNIGDKFEEDSNIMEFFTARFILDGNLVVLKTSNSGCDIYYYKDMKNSNEKLIGTSTVHSAVISDEYGMFGVYNDNLYLIEATEGSTSENLVVIDKNGNITRTPII